MTIATLEQIDTLERVRGHGTSLISIYVPGNSDLSGIRGTITKESSAASNIKSKQTRKAVQQSLRSLQNYVKGYPTHRAPQNGLVILAGADQLV